MNLKSRLFLEIGIITVFACWLFYPVIFQGKTISAFDMLHFMSDSFRPLRNGQAHPSNILLSDPVLEFQPWDIAAFEGPLCFPWLWNPYSGCGTPFLGNWQSAPYFPLKHLVYPIFGVRYGFGVFYLLKVWLSGIFMLVWLKSIKTSSMVSIAGSISFMACGFMTAWLQWPHTNVAMFIPLFFWCVYVLTGRFRSRETWILIAIVSMCLLGGHPETLVHILFFSVFFLLSSRWMPGLKLFPGSSPLNPSLQFTAALLIGISFAAIQVVPAVEYIGNSWKLASRSLENSNAFDLRAVLNPPDWEFTRRELTTYLVPDAFGDPGAGKRYWNEFSNYNESAGYIGLGMFMMACFAWSLFRKNRLVRSFCLIQVISLAFINAFPQVTHTLGALPLLNVAANKRMLLVFCFSSVTLASIALDDWIHSKKLGKWRLLFLGMILCGFGALAALWFRISQNTGLPPEAILNARTGLIRLVIAGILAIICLIGLRIRKMPVSRAAAASFLILTATDLFVHHAHHNPAIEPGELYPQIPVLEVLQKEPFNRTAFLDKTLLTEMPVVYGIRDVRIFDALIYRPYQYYLETMGTRSDWQLIDRAPNAMTRIGGARFILAGREELPASFDFRTVFENEKMVLYEDTAARPYAYLTDFWEVGPGPTKTLRRLAGWKPGDPAAWIARTGAGFERMEQKPAVFIRDVPFRMTSPGHLEFNLPSDANGLLVINETDYPGWTARVDGKPRRILRANGVFQGIFIEPGDRFVTMEYQPLSCQLGCFVSLMTLLVLIIFSIQEGSLTQGQVVVNPRDH